MSDHPLTDELRQKQYAEAESNSKDGLDRQRREALTCLEAVEASRTAIIRACVALEVSKRLHRANADRDARADWASKDDRCWRNLRDALDAADPVKSEEKQRQRVILEDTAKAIYNAWTLLKGWVPWVENGNSDMQRRARDIAQQALLISEP